MHMFLLNRRTLTMTSHSNNDDWDMCPFCAYEGYSAELGYCYECGYDEGVIPGIEDFDDEL
jgi:ribosomal protein L37E